MAHFDDDDDYVVSPRDFEDPIFADNNRELFDQYIDFRIQGHRPHMALRMTFGEDFAGDGQLMARSFCIERNPYIREHYPKRLANAKVGSMWNAKTSAHELLMLVRDPTEKGNVRIAAIKELNQLAGITIDDTDDKPNRRGLDDFYTNAPTQQEQARQAIIEAKAQGDAQAPTKH